MTVKIMQGRVGVEQQIYNKSKTKVYSLLYVYSWAWNGIFLILISKAAIFTWVEYLKLCKTEDKCTV